MFKMFQNRRTVAINRFKTQLVELQKLKDLLGLQNWMTYTDAIALEYIGHNNFHSQKFGKTDLSNLPDIGNPIYKDQEFFTIKQGFARQYVERCIQHLEDNGTMTPQSHIFSRTDHSLLWTIIWGTILGAFFGGLYLGIWWAKTPFNPENYPKSDNSTQIDTNSSIIAPDNSVNQSTKHSAEPKRDSN